MQSTLGGQDYQLINRSINQLINVREPGQLISAIDQRMTVFKELSRRRRRMLGNSA